VYIDI